MGRFNDSFLGSPYSATNASTAPGNTFLPNAATTAAWKANWPAATGASSTNPVVSSGPIATTAPKGAIIVDPGDDVAAVVKAAPAGSVFFFIAGTYRMQRIAARSNDTYIGAQGAILNGSELLTTFVKSGAYWMVTGQTQKNQLNGHCQAAYPRCMYSEDLFVDNVPYTQVAALSDLNPGNKNWFFDYDAHIIYMADDPTGHTVETSVARSAFFGASATNVTIKNFVVEKYAIPMQMGAIGDQVPGTNWLVQNNEVLLNHGVGLRLGPNSSAIGNHVHHNGEMGLGGSGMKLLFQGNEIDHNNYYSGVSCGWECGGTKFSSSQYLMVKGNYSHDNFGAGFWTDVNNIYSTYDGNWIINNRGEGIHHEVSYDVLIQNNRVENNGGGNVTWLWSSQIEIVNSQNGEVRNNAVTVADWSSGYEGNAIGVLYQDRSADSETYGSHNHVTGNSIHDNDVTFAGTGVTNKGGVGIACDLQVFNHQCPVANQDGVIAQVNPSVYDNGQNNFYSNNYHVPTSGINNHYFRIAHPTNSGVLTTAQSFGQEIGSTLTAN